MDSELLGILKEALETRQRKEELDRAVGRAVRRRNLEFKIYIQIMIEVREFANAEGIDKDEAARMLVGEPDN